MLLKGKTSEEEHLQLSLLSYSYQKLREGIAQIVPPSGNVMKNICVI